jgi:hypothetical protein
MKTPTPSVPFERLPGEPAREFRALVAHRDFGAGRSIARTAAAVGLGESTLRRFSAAWDWPARLAAWDDAVLAQLADQGEALAAAKHRDDLERFAATCRRRAERLAESAELLLDLAISSTRRHLEQGTLLHPQQLAAAMGAASRALEASGNTAAAALGIDDLMSEVERLGLAESADPAAADRSFARYVPSSPGDRC